MANNSFGQIFRITTWGESHGKAIGVVIDGCPANLEISDKEINDALVQRAPGKTPYTSPRAEKDQAEILSGVFKGKTTGAPISIIIYNKDADSSKYEGIKDLLRPGHANFTYLEKYGIFDYRGGGRSSARETACRVAAGAIAKKFLKRHQIEINAYISSIFDITAKIDCDDPHLIHQKTYASPIFCPDEVAAKKMMQKIEEAKEKKDSVGAVIEFIVHNLPVGLGDPVYEKLEASLAKAMMSLPATKGFEIGDGFQATKMFGSEHNDSFIIEKDKIKTKTNHSGGTLGGISSGMPLIARVAFKPTSSILKEQESVNFKTKKKCSFAIPPGSRHDPCVAIRAVPIVEAMASIVFIDTILMNRCVKL